MPSATRVASRCAVLCLCLLAVPSPAVGQAPRAADAPAAAITAAERDSIVALARAQIGRRYRLGGERPEDGFDCSGLVRYILSAFDLRAPRTAALQAMFGKEVNRDRETLRPGDLLTFGRGSRISHVGIYVGDGRYVHASTSSGRVVESSLDRTQSSLVRSWRGVRRVFVSPDSARLAAVPEPAPPRP